MATILCRQVWINRNQKCTSPNVGVCSKEARSNRNFKYSCFPVSAKIYIVIIFVRSSVSPYLGGWPTKVPPSQSLVSCHLLPSCHYHQSPTKSLKCSHLSKHPLNTHKHESTPAELTHPSISNASETSSISNIVWVKQKGNFQWMSCC